MEKKQNNGTKTVVARKAYEAKAGIEAVERVGRNPQVKGVIHEVIFRDTQNMNPKNILDGTKVVLSKSTTAVRDDVLFINNGKVVGRYQLKDTVPSISKTVNQAASGKYAGTNLLGTTETVQAYEQAVDRMASKGTVVTQKMSSTGISSADTSRIAAETIGGNLSKYSLAKVAGTSGVAGGAIAGAFEVFRAGKDLADGEIDEGEFEGRVAKETVGGGISAAGGSVAATAVSAGVATALATTAAPIWIPAAVGLGTAVAVGSVIKGIWDAFWN